MTTYAQRSVPASAWENQLLTFIVAQGWLAAPFGQSQIPEEMRPWLRRFRDSYGRPTLLRWTPDIIAVKPCEPPFACLVDAKTDSAKNASSPNYSVEIHAVEAGLAIVRDWNTPLFYSWPDGGVLTPDIARNRYARRIDGAGVNGGSGTAFYLIPKVHALRARDVFSAVTGTGG